MWRKWLMFQNIRFPCKHMKYKEDYLRCFTLYLTWLFSMCLILIQEHVLLLLIKSNLPRGIKGRSLHNNEETLIGMELLWQIARMRCCITKVLVINLYEFVQRRTMKVRKLCMSWCMSANKWREHGFVHKCIAANEVHVVVSKWSAGDRVHSVVSKCIAATGVHADSCQ